MSKYSDHHEMRRSPRLVMRSPGCWYALYTRSKYEKLVAEQLSAKGVENFLPLSRETHRWKDRKKVVDVPVFRSYVFARFSDRAEQRLRVLRTVGSVRLLGLGDGIEPIPDTQIEATTSPT